MSQKSQPDGGRRLKRNDLVMTIFFLFADEQEHSDAESIWDLELPMERIRQHLLAVHGVAYRSNQWIFTQLRRYEQEAGVQLFRKVSGGSRDEFRLAIHQPMESFHQKRHLYVTQKIKVANGVYDKIRNDVSRLRLDRPVRILLGAGSTIYHLATIFSEQSWEDDNEYAIYTHNVGSLQTLLNHNVNYDRISVSLMNGTIDPITYTVVGPDTRQFTSAAFDFVVQGTSVVNEGHLYIESAEERKAKHAILHECSGTKILVVTKHEFTDAPLPGVESYGRLSDYDFVVVPRSSAEADRPKKTYDRVFEQYGHLFEPEIMNWNYTILRVVP